MLDANRIAQKFLKKAADVPVPEAPAAHQVTSARLMDLLVFSVAYDSFIEAMSEKQQSPAKLATKGLSLFSRFAPELTAGMNQHLAHLLDNPTAGTLKPGFHRAIMSGAPNTRIHMVAHFVKTCLPWMKSHTSIIQDTFPSRSGIAARSLAAACMEQSTASRLNKVAGIAPVTTGLSTLKHWTALAAEEAGVPLRPIEGALADATMAKGLGEDLKKLNVEIATSDPNTPEAAELQTKRTQILDEIQKVSDESGDPQTVMATAVSAATTTQMHATEIGKRLGHTPDQEAAMMVRGRALIAAGAGSGKCIKGDTLVQTSNGFIPIKDLAIGLEPEQDRELEMTVNGINGPEKTSHIYFDGFRKTLKIETAHGYELEGTGPHKILVMQKGTPTWVALQDIKIGDKACIDARPGLFAKTPFIGKIESDFGIPYDILRACKPSVTEFLRDMLDDADVYEDSIEFFTEDNQLAVELHNLLLAYGIAAQRDGSPEVGWCFYIQESDLKTFAKEIGFKSKEKQDDLAAAVANLATTEPEGWFLDPVINISESEAEVYDFVVPGTHSFSAGGFINHNTRVLASQVAYHINELGVPASSIMATSFTRKASAELMKRVSKYGAVIEGPATDGFGTTHAICGNILNKRAREFKKVSYMGREEGWKQTTLLRLAMEQVKMSASGGQTPPEPKGLWDGAYVPDGGTQTQQGISPQVQDNDREFRSALREATGYFQWAARTWPGDRGRWAAKAVSMLQNVQGKSVLDLRPDQKQAVNEIFSKVKVKGEFPIKYRVASQNVEAYVSRDDDEPDPNDASPKQRHNKLEGYTYFKTPARQWFNLGHDLTKETEENAGKKGKTGVPVGEFKNAISILKGKGLSPSQAWADSPFGKHSDKAAVYAAYEWLKSPKGEPEFAGQGDMDDILIDTVKALVASPNLRHQIQAQYKCILVDEAQDLNRCVSGDTIVITPSGEKRIRDLVVGDKIQSYENGLVLYREVTAKAQSSWNRGYKICTQNGREITMSPDHQIYATAPLAIPKGKLALYLMYRKDLGFRIGVSSRPILRTAKGCGGRGSSERADCIWILEINDVEDILFKEQAYSLTYAVPTQVYEGTVRGLNQARIDRVFNEFGMNGQKLLAKYDLNFNLPHWINPTVSDAKTNRKVVNLYAHRCNGKKEQRASSACITYTGEDYPGDLPTYTLKGNRKMVTDTRSNYSRARESAFTMAKLLDARVAETLMFGSEKMPLITSSGLFPGMKILVTNGQTDFEPGGLFRISDYRKLAKTVEVTIKGKKLEAHELIRKAQIARGIDNVLPPLRASHTELDEIISVEPVIGGDYWDISVEETQNFFGNGILSHNCQHLVFGLMAGYVDPKTMEPHKDGHMTADTFALVGDDKQCVEKNSLISTSSGDRPLYEIKKGDLILAYRNGRIVEQVVRHAVLSSWTWGYKVTTASGKSLTMSTNHKLWATAAVPENPIVQLLAHTPEGSLVSIVETTDKESRGTVGCFDSYRKALALADKLASEMRTKTVKLLSVNDRILKQLTAGNLLIGMSLPALEKDQTLALDPIVSIEKVPGEFIDIDVDDASNFFGANLLISNSIFEFRGAEPDEFIKRSDKVNDEKTGEPGKFTTKILDTNFRSGSEIVDTANKLISLNKRQVPMVCKATPEKGQGNVISRPVDSTEEAALSVADEIDELAKAGHIDHFDQKEGTGGYASFGIAVRSNAEAYDYGLEMLKKGIPFKSNASFFGDSNTKALIGWLTIAEHGLSGPAEMVNDAVKNAVKAPFSKLGQAFFTQLEQKSRGPWPKWLVDGGYKDIYSGGKWQDILKNFVDNLEEASEMKGSPAELMEKLLQLKGIDGETMHDALIHSVEENDEIMSQLAAESETGTVSDEAIVEQALAPIKPLRGLLGGKKDLGDAMTYVRKLQAVNARISSKDTASELDRDAVTIGTMHSWKGLEVPRMYVPMVGGKFPRTNPEGVVEEGPNLWSERRLAYVAITRAEQQCTILDIPHPKTGKRSQFITEGCIRSEHEKATAGAVPAGKVGSHKITGNWNRAAVLSFLDQAVKLKIDEWIRNA